MRYFDSNIKKIDLMKYMKKNLNNYIITEEESEYQELYRGYTSARYNIKPNKFKGNPTSASLNIDRDSGLVMVLGGNHDEAISLINKFKRRTINKKIIIDHLKTVYSIGNKFKFFEDSDFSDVINNVSVWLENTHTIRQTLQMGLKYGMIGLTTTGRSNAKTGQLYVNESFYIADNLSIITCHTLEFPMKGLFKLIVSILHDGKNTKTYLNVIENGTVINVTESKLFREQLEDRFLNRYQAAIKKWIGTDNAEFSEEYLLLIEMVKI